MNESAQKEKMTKFNNRSNCHIGPQGHAAVFSWLINSSYRMPAMKISVALLLALFATACSGCNGDSPEQAALTAAISTWNADEPSHYLFVSTRSCECSPGASMPMLIEVQDGDIVSAVYQTDQEPVPPEFASSLHTVDSLFDVIQDAIDEGAYSVNVDYDSQRGHPTLISIDYDQQIADEEFFLRVSELEVLVDVGL